MGSIQKLIKKIFIKPPYQKPHSNANELNQKNQFEIIQKWEIYKYP
jgi:deoxycytidylate deaminase